MNDVGRERILGRNWPDSGLRWILESTDVCVLKWCWENCLFRPKETGED